MRKIMVMLLAAMLAAAGVATQKATAKEKNAAAGVKKELRWHGTIVRINKDQSTMDVRKGTMERKIHFDSSTKWTAANKAAEMDQFKEGSDVICLGTADEKGEFLATRVDLRH